MIERLLGRGKTILLHMFDNKNSMVHKMRAEEVYNSHPWFQNYPLSKFALIIKTMQIAVKNLEDDMSEDKQEIRPKLTAFPRG